MRLCCKLSIILPAGILALTCLGLLFVASTPFDRFCGDQNELNWLNSICPGAIEVAKLNALPAIVPPLPLVYNAQQVVVPPTPSDDEVSEDEGTSPGGEAASGLEAPARQEERDAANLLVSFGSEPEDGLEALPAPEPPPPPPPPAPEPPPPPPPEAAEAPKAKRRSKRPPSKDTSAQDVPKATPAPTVPATAKTPPATAGAGAAAEVHEGQRARILRDPRLEAWAASWVNINSKGGCGGTGPAPPAQQCPKGRRKKCDTYCGGRIHFLFMVTDSLYFVPIWKEFFRHAPRGSWRGWLHCVRPEKCQRSGVLKELPNIKLVETVRTTRCADLVTAEAQLVKAALAATKKRKDVVEKYILVSDTALPVKPFSTVYAALTGGSESGFCFMTPKSWVPRGIRWDSRIKKIVDGDERTPTQLVKHSQFFVLNREDAETFASRWKKVTTEKGHWSSWDVPLLNSRWWKLQGTILILPSRMWAETPDFALNGICADEYAVFATIYGAFDRSFPLTDWTRKPACPLNRSMRCVSNEDIMRHSRCYTLSTARTSNALLSAIKKDKDSWVKPGRDGHGFEFKALGRYSLQLLRNSTYLFVRKFNAQCNMSNYEEILLSVSSKFH